MLMEYGQQDPENSLYAQSRLKPTDMQHRVRGIIVLPILSGIVDGALQCNVTVKSAAVNRLRGGSC